MTTQKRAKPGGEHGPNREWYKGGAFIATTEQPKGKPKPKGSGKRQIEPYKWEVVPDGKRTIWSAFGGFEGCLVRNDLSTLSPQTIAFYHLDLNKLNDLMARYHRGERYY